AGHGGRVATSTTPEKGSGHAHGEASLAVPLVAWLPLAIRRRLRGVYHGFAYARSMLGDPIISANAIGGVQTRMASRATVSLDTIERTILAYPSSPYRPLLEAAGYDFTRIRALIGHAGVEQALRQLAADGVYVAIEEFKGIREARRGNRVFRFSHE